MPNGTEPCGEYDTEEEARKEFVKAEEVLNHRKDCKPECRSSLLECAHQICKEEY